MDKAKPRVIVGRKATLREEIQDSMRRASKPKCLATVCRTYGVKARVPMR